MNKLPQITLAFWVMKICATTLGETAHEIAASAQAQARGTIDEAPPLVRATQVHGPRGHGKDRRARWIEPFSAERRTRAPPSPVSCQLMLLPIASKLGYAGAKAKGNNDLHTHRNRGL